MSHGTLRHDNTCLNCGSIVRIRYCSNCGQENIEPKESFGGLINHFFSDITHFDGKFFLTTKYLFRSPGFLPKEYISGKRARFLHPIRMYVFTSALFFLVFFPFSAKRMAPSGPINVQADSIDLSPLRQYDSLQRSLAPSQRDNWMTKRATKQGISLAERARTDLSALIKDIGEKLLHSFPYLLFISLPLIALYLKWLYLRHKKFYYTDHGIFLIYLYIFTFLLLLLFISLRALQEATGWRFISWINLVVGLFGIYYAFAAMRRFYGQGFFKTLFKFTVLNVLSIFTMLILLGLFFVLTIFQV